jgi:TetR/AcrR family transcriptional repressor of nem operon
MACKEYPMARPREFDPEDVLAAAMNVFWEHGYDAASMPILLKGMGMTRGSLYKAFKDKKSLFLMALDRYDNEAVQAAVGMLTTGTSDGVDRIHALFDSVVAVVRSGDRRGCLLCSAAAGPAAVDDEISHLVQLQLGQMQHAFGVALANSSAHANMDEQERSEMAGLLLSLYVGLRVLVRSKASIEMLELNASGLKQLVGLSGST